MYLPFYTAIINTSRSQTLSRLNSPAAAQQLGCAEYPGRKSRRKHNLTNDGWCARAHGCVWHYLLLPCQRRAAYPMYHLSSPCPVALQRFHVFSPVPVPANTELSHHSLVETRMKCCLPPGNNSAHTILEETTISVIVCSASILPSSVIPITHQSKAGRSSLVERHSTFIICHRLKQHIHRFLFYVLHT